MSIDGTRQRVSLAPVIKRHRFATARGFPLGVVLFFSAVIAAYSGGVSGNPLNRISLCSDADGSLYGGWTCNRWELNHPYTYPYAVPFSKSGTNYNRDFMLYTNHPIDPNDADTQDGTIRHLIVAIHGSSHPTEVVAANVNAVDKTTYFTVSSFHPDVEKGCIVEWIDAGGNLNHREITLVLASMNGGNFVYYWHVDSPITGFVPGSQINVYSDDKWKDGLPRLHYNAILGGTLANNGKDPLDKSYPYGDPEYLVIVPHFQQYKNDPVWHEPCPPSQCVRWHTNWRSGSKARGFVTDDTSGSVDISDTFTSFEALDSIVRLLIEDHPSLFPNLETVAFWGHSAGGRLINRYMPFADISPMVDEKIAVRFVSESPGDVMYLTPNRLYHNAPDWGISPDDMIENLGLDLGDCAAAFYPPTQLDDYYWFDDPNDPIHYDSFVLGDGRVGLDGYPDSKEDLLNNALQRDHVQYVGGEELCKSVDDPGSGEPLAQGNNHVYVAYSYYLHNQCLYPGEHNTVFRVADGATHNTNKLINHPEIEEILFSENTSFNCTTGTMDPEWIAVCTDAAVANTYYWDEIRIYNRTYTSEKTITNHSGSIVLTNITIENMPTGEQFIIQSEVSPSHNISSDADPDTPVSFHTGSDC